MLTRSASEGHRVRGSCVGTDGRGTDIDYEVSYFPNETVAFWHLDGPFAILCRRRENFKLNVAVKQEWDSWQRLWARCGMSVKDVFTPSERMVGEAQQQNRGDSHRGRMGDPRFISDKASVRTDGFILLHGFWCAYGRTWRRTLATAALAAFLAATIDHAELARLDWEGVFWECAAPLCVVAMEPVGVFWRWPPWGPLIKDKTWALL